jgi:hypothetical protein
MLGKSLGLPGARFDAQFEEYSFAPGSRNPVHPAKEKLPKHIRELEKSQSAARQP